MLNADVTRYLSLRRALGYKLVQAKRHLLAFARFAAERGESHIRTATVLAWLPIAAKTPNAMAHRLTSLIMFARFLHAEDPRHEIPPADMKRTNSRPVPYIYTADEIARILDAAGSLRHQKIVSAAPKALRDAFWADRSDWDACVRGRYVTAGRYPARRRVTHSRDQVPQVSVVTSAPDRR